MTKATINHASVPVPDAAVGHAVLPRTLGTFRLAVFVVAAVAPLAGVIGTLPVALVFGSGTALPLAFVVVTAVMALFAVGYSAISREVIVGGAFYAYIARGLGTITGLGAACVAVISYTMFVPGGLSYLGFVMQTSVSELLGYKLPWIVYSLGAWVLVGLLGLRKIDFSARAVLALIVLEFLLLLAFDSSIVGRLGSAALPMVSLNWRGMTEGAPGVAILLAFTCYFGIESAALYSEEAKSPEKTVARATYIAISVIGIFYFLTSWITVGAVGPNNISGIKPDDIGLIYFKLSNQFMNATFTHVIQAAIVTSMFATVLSLHNVAARYLFVLGRQGCLPAALGRAHPKHGSPSVASTTVSLVSLIVVGGAAYLGLHPMLGLGLIALGFAAVGVMFLQALTSLAIISYFRGRSDRKVWSHIVAPALSLIGLIGALVIAVDNFEFLSGSQNPVVNRIPVGIPIAMASGVLLALWLRRYRPAKFAAVLNS
ncbi:APC family permease [Massilia orientalis]|uniref:APC family permease n=1 Tax=Massilia orientalis TaxID=3050128 RepID=A0ACC7MK28_9BURK|nr:APC family permease [Massilia sp. YIM B02787]